MANGPWFGHSTGKIPSSDCFLSVKVFFVSVGPRYGILIFGLNEVLSNNLLDVISNDGWAQ